LEAVTGTHSVDWVPKTAVLGTGQCCSVSGGGLPSVLQKNRRQGNACDERVMYIIHPQVLSSTGLPTFLPLYTYAAFCFTVLFVRLCTAVQFISFLLSFLSSVTLVANVSTVTTARCCELRRVTLPVCSVLSTRRKTERDAICMWFQAFAAMWIRSALFWNVTQRSMVISYRRVRTTDRSHLQGSRILGLEDGTDRLSRNVRTKLPFYAGRHPRRAQITHTAYIRISFCCQVQPLADSMKNL
jgi:hypothetical protein